MADDTGNDVPPKANPRKKPRAASRYADAKYEVGKGKPPKASQFKAGGKPGPGRPRRSRNRTPLDKLLDERIVIGEDSLGRPIRKTLRDITNRKLVQLAMNGEIRALRLIKEHEYRAAELERRYGPPPPTVEEILKKQEEDRQRKEAADILLKSLHDSLEFKARLKHHNLIDTVDGVPRFTSKAERAFRLADEEEFRSRGPEAHDEWGKTGDGL